MQEGLYPLTILTFLLSGKNHARPGKFCIEIVIFFTIFLLIKVISDGLMNLVENCIVYFSLHGEGNL